MSPQSCVKNDHGGVGEKKVPICPGPGEKVFSSETVVENVQDIAAEVLKRGNMRGIENIEAFGGGGISHGPRHPGGEVVGEIGLSELGAEQAAMYLLFYRSMRIIRSRKP